MHVSREYKIFVSVWMSMNVCSCLMSFSQETSSVVASCVSLRTQCMLARYIAIAIKERIAVLRINLL